VDEGIIPESSKHIQTGTASCLVFSQLDPLSPGDQELTILRGLTLNLVLTTDVWLLKSFDFSGPEFLPLYLRLVLKG
jgi:hypothetical protein